MTDELIDIIDEENRVLYQASKSEAHAKGLLHRTIIAEVINTKGEWLLVRQAVERQDAGQYVSPVGGHVRAGEAEVEALKREANEELGITDFSYKRVGAAIFNRSVIGRRENHLFILYEIYSDAVPVLNHESVGYAYFTKPELISRVAEHPDEFGDAWHFVYRQFYTKT
jgi:8-oxo-dGTP pyrophosphatase MutT (NUDIX family)